MLNKENIQKAVQEAINNTDTFLVDVKTTSDNKVSVYVDSLGGIPVQECVRISKFITSRFDKDIEDYELHVSSPGLNQPFKVINQYEKHINKEVKVVLTDGITYEGTITKIKDNTITLEWTETFKKPGQKKKITEKIIKDLTIGQIASAKPIIRF